MKPPRSDADHASELVSLALEYAENAVKGDEASCLAIYERAVGTGAGMIEVYQEFLGTGMFHVGTWYHKGEINEAGEHMASAITERLMTLASFHFGQGPSNGLQVLLGGGPDSWHVIGLRMLADVLRHRGWRTMYLGPNVPTLSFVETVRVNGPDLVLLSCSASEAMTGTLNLIHGLQAFRKANLNHRPFLIGVGGLLATVKGAAFRDAGADFTSPDLKSFVGEEVLELERVGTTTRQWHDARLRRFPTPA